MFVDLCRVVAEGKLGCTVGGSPVLVGKVWREVVIEPVVRVVIEFESVHSADLVEDVAIHVVAGVDVVWVVDAVSVLVVRVGTTCVLPTVTCVGVCRGTWGRLRWIICCVSGSMFSISVIEDLGGVRTWLGVLVMQLGQYHGVLLQPPVVFHLSVHFLWKRFPHRLQASS